MNPSSQESPTLQSAQSLPTGLFGASVVKHHGKLVRMHVIVKGIACVFGDADQMIEDPAILSSHDGLVYNDERFTDYLGGLENEDALAALLIPGGYLRFEYDGHSQFLTASPSSGPFGNLTTLSLSCLSITLLDNGVMKSAKTLLPKRA